MSHTGLTYRGSTYQKPKFSTKESPEIKRVSDSSSHIYRGIRYHYETKKKALA